MHLRGHLTILPTPEPAPKAGITKHLKMSYAIYHNMHTYTCIYWYQIFGHLDWHIVYIPIPFRLSPDFPISMVHHLTNKHRTLSPPNPRWLLIKSSSNIGINGKKWEGTSAIHYTNVSDTNYLFPQVSPIEFWNKLARPSPSATSPPVAATLCYLEVPGRA